MIDVPFWSLPAVGLHLCEFDSSSSQDHFMDLLPVTSLPYQFLLQTFSSVSERRLRSVLATFQLRAGGVER